ncbi:MAG: hypothetical protein ACRELB_06970 [Polyangiaceae bacterium]
MKRGGPLLVTVVAKHHDTREGLKTYLQGAGVSTTTTGSLERVVEMTPPSATAVILFPDEYETGAALRALALLKATRAQTIPVIVTGEPRRFEEPDTDPPQRTAPLVLPKPAWAWTMMDAVRARLEFLSTFPGGEPTPKGRDAGRGRA